MNKAKQRFIAGGVLVICACAGTAGLSQLSRKVNEGAVAANAPYNEELPVIILDAGHGGSD